MCLDVQVLSGSPRGEGSRYSGLADLHCSSCAVVGGKVALLSDCWDGVFCSGG